MFAKLNPLFPYMRRYWRGYLWGCLCTIVANAVWVQFPRVIGLAADDLTRGVTWHKILGYAGLVLAVTAVHGVLLYYMRWIIIGISRDIEFDLRNDLFAQLEKQPASYYQEHRTGDIMARMTNDLSAVRMLLGPAVMYTANTVLFFAGSLYFLLRISPFLTLTALAPMPLASVFIQFMGRRIHERFERIQAMFSDISAQAQENFSGARLVRAFTQEDAQIRAFERSNQEYIRRALRLVRLMGMLWPTLEFMLGLAMVIALLVGGHEVLTHRIGIRGFVTFTTYLMMLTWPIIALGYVVNLFERGTASVLRIHELLIAEPAIDDRAAKLAPDRVEIRGDIEFRNLHFAYPAENAQPVEVLHGISLTIPAGSSLALVGPTGSGKSTLVSLIPRLFDAPGGSVLIDGRPVRDYPLDPLRAAIGFVPQETFLFSTSIRHNIAFGVESAADEAVSQAAAIALIRDEFQLFPGAFDTVVGERGLTLSGGQKQRTALARAVLRNPRILILDDALASVDTYTEERILEELRSVMAGRTTILISHRVSTVRHADRIAVLVRGSIAELGTHEELLARNGYYASLYQKQLLEEELAVTG
ncbi:MAG TPA: ABC transporter ATP-binding protein [Acidobacteriaceae bacterium]|jgi:ATP-binding cassette, subfamily B, multidrug efflux pump|nr:ABC transporter ATP-binding protein [Acidobacteriaceae bacterium]